MLSFPFYFMYLFLIIRLSVFVSRHSCSSHGAFVELEDNVQESVLSSHGVGPGDQTPVVVGLCTSCSHMQSHLFPLHFLLDMRTSDVRLA